MRLVVTGGRGFIGSHFVEEALAKGFSIVDIDKMPLNANGKVDYKILSN